MVGKQKAPSCVFTTSGDATKHCATADHDDAARHAGQPRKQLAFSVHRLIVSREVNNIRPRPDTDTAEYVCRRLDTSRNIDISICLRADLKIQPTRATVS